MNGGNQFNPAIIAQQAQDPGHPANPSHPKVRLFLVEGREEKRRGGEEKERKKKRMSGIHIPWEVLKREREELLILM